MIMNNITIKYDQKRSLTLVMGMGTALCLALIIFRVHISGNLLHVFLVWNLFLAWIPIFLSGKLLKMNDQEKPWWALAGIFFIWLVFFPNSPYIMTDLFHLRKRQDVPLWYDLVLIISFAWNGLMLGFISLLEVQKFLNRKFSGPTVWVIIIAVLFLSGFGIDLGRFERWNSWDVLTNPVSLLRDILEKIFNPFSHPRTIGVTLLFSSFLTVSYLTLFTLIRSKHHGS
jgi:uncharacterized membrane protein